MWVPVDSQRPAHLGAPRPHADHPTSVSPRQSFGDLGGDRERPAAALRALHPFLSGEQHHPCGGRGVPARRAPPAPRARHCPLVLADGTVLATGGERTGQGNNVGQAVYEAELWNPATETWSTMARLQRPRLYHSG